MEKILLKHVLHVTRLLSCSFMILGLGLPLASHGEVNGIKEGNAAIQSQAADTVTGTVTDINGLPIPGVTVLIPGTTVGTATDLDGKYSINVPEGSTLVFSFIGYDSQSIPVGAQSVIDVILKEDISSLEIGRASC